ncbi:hypothetical protein [Cyanobium sp. PCC 7001]|uniref:hypothetical protein n=1 Tax=Cyanobium sp. PCC 7001 TaxID=180281 RepID=UPI0005BA2D9B|nr:hypothetical protein [Cyanobium sp. PCC 7001]
MAQPFAEQRELVIHTGLDPTLISELALEASLNRKQLRKRGISLHPGAALVPAVLRNNWQAWRQHERLRLWKPWRRDDHLWAVAPSLVNPLLQERRLSRLQHQVGAMGFRLAVVVHLLDGREQLARDYVRALTALRFCGSLDDYVARQLERHPQRYLVDRLFEPLLEWLGARGLRFVLHSAAPADRLATTWGTLDHLGGAGPLDSTTPPIMAPETARTWAAPVPLTAGLSLHQVKVAQELLQGLGHPPRGRQREQLRKSLEARVAAAASDEPPVHSWAVALGAGAAPAGVSLAQDRLGLKVWGMGWPATASSLALADSMALTPRRRRQAMRRSRRRSG